MKHFKFLSILSVFFLLISCGPSGVEIRGQFYTSGADVPSVGADDMVKVENGMCHCDQWYYTSAVK